MLQGYEIKRNSLTEQITCKLLFENIFSDYELYQILEGCKYKTTEKNLKLLKEGLESGKYLIEDTVFQEIKDILLDDSLNEMAKFKISILKKCVKRMNEKQLNKIIGKLESQANKANDKKAKLAISKIKTADIEKKREVIITILDEIKKKDPKKYEKAEEEVRAKAKDVLKKEELENKKLTEEAENKRLTAADLNSKYKLKLSKDNIAKLDTTLSKLSDDELEKFEASIANYAAAKSSYYLSNKKEANPNAEMHVVTGSLALIVGIALTIIIALLGGVLVWPIITAVVGGADLLYGLATLYT